MAADRFALVDGQYRLEEDLSRGECLFACVIHDSVTGQNHHLEHLAHMGSFDTVFVGLQQALGPVLPKWEATEYVAFHFDGKIIKRKSYGCEDGGTTSPGEAIIEIQVGEEKYTIRATTPSVMGSSVMVLLKAVNFCATLG